MLIKVFSVLSMFLKLSTFPPWECLRRRGGGQASCLVAKQAVEFPHRYWLVHALIIIAITTSRTCGKSTACVCYLNWKPVDPQQTDGPVGKAGLELQTL